MNNYFVSLNVLNDGSCEVQPQIEKSENLENVQISEIKYYDADGNEVPENQLENTEYTIKVIVGDGETDVPCMKLIKQMGGNTIAVYEPKNERKREVAKKILNQDRCDYVCPADYSPGKNLDTLVKGIICKIKADDDLKKLKQEFKKKGYR